MTTIEAARQEHTQASRNVRRLQEARRYQSSARLDRDYYAATERQQKAAAELVRLQDEQTFAPIATRTEGEVQIQGPDNHGGARCD
jgi:hypothetical protein